MSGKESAIQSPPSLNYRRFEDIGFPTLREMMKILPANIVIPTNDCSGRELIRPKPVLGVFGATLTYVRTTSLPSPPL